MGDTFDPATRSWIMGRVKSKGTSPEMKVRRTLHAAGYRFRLHRKDLPGAPDLVLSRYQMVIFVHGCFWHWHGCKRSRMPATNRVYWEGKIGRNVARDAMNQKALEDAGWRYRIIWECELSTGIANVLAELAELKTPLS